MELCGEEYTSQTCGRCGQLNKELGKEKQFRCPGCGLNTDRDFNGSRNVLLKQLTHLQALDRHSDDAKVEAGGEGDKNNKRKKRAR